MAAKSHYLQKKALGNALVNTAYTPPTTVYLALFTAAPTDQGGGTEVTTTGTAYARQAITFGAAVDNGSSAGAYVTNTGAVTFAQATANYGTITSWGIYDASTGGNLLYYGNLGTSVAVNSGNQYTVPASSITITEL